MQISGSLNVNQISKNTANLQGGNAKNLLNVGESESGKDNQNLAQTLKKRLEKARISQMQDKQNPYVKTMLATLEAQKGAINAQILQINSQLLSFEVGKI